MKKSIKIAFIVLVAVAMLFVATSVFADEYTPGSVKNQINTTNTEKVQGVGGRILGIIRVVGTIAAVGILIVLGIKYMMGSAEERAEYKKTLFPYFIGAILIFAAANLADMIYSWAQSI